MAFIDEINDTVYKPNSNPNWKKVVPVAGQSNIYEITEVNIEKQGTPLTIETIRAIAPDIGPNGNWHIGKEDRGIRAEGIQGPPGINGKDGRDGRDGIDGSSGKDGINGRDGKDGINGVDGVNGRDGVNADGFLGFYLGNGYDADGGKYTQYPLNAAYLGEEPQFKCEYAEDSDYITTTIKLIN